MKIKNKNGMNKNIIYMNEDDISIEEYSIKEEYINNKYKGNIKEDNNEYKTNLSTSKEVIKNKNFTEKKNLKENLLFTFTLNDNDLDEMFESYHKFKKKSDKNNDLILTKKQFYEKVKNMGNQLLNSNLNLNLMLDKNLNENNKNDEDKSFFLTDNIIKEQLTKKNNLDKQKLNELINKKIELIKKKNSYFFENNSKNREKDNKVTSIFDNNDNNHNNHIIENNINNKKNIIKDNFYLNILNMNMKKMKIIIITNEKFYNTLISNYIYGFINPIDKIIYSNNIKQDYEKISKKMIIKTNNENINLWEEKYDDKFDLYFFLFKKDNKILININESDFQRYKDKKNIIIIEDKLINYEKLERNIHYMYKKLYEIFKNKLELSKLGTYERIYGLNKLFKEIMKTKKNKYYNDFFHLEL